MVVYGVNMMRTKDGLVHLVESHEGKDFKGMLRCGLLYRRKAKRRTTWVPMNIAVKGREVVAVRSGKKPTCVWCVARIRQC
jgi:hypothetical protein